MDNAASEKQVKKMVSRDERLAHRQQDDLKVVLGSIHGKRLLWRIMTECAPFQSPLHASGSQLYYNVGRQDIGRFIMDAVLSADPKKFLEMQIEAKDYENV